MIDAQKKVYGYDAQFHPIADIILSTEHPAGMPMYYGENFLTLEVTFNITKKIFLFFDDIKKALEICKESPRDTTLRIKVPYYEVTSIRLGMHRKTKGLVVIEYNKDGTHTTFTIAGIKFFIDVEEFYNAIKLLGKLWEPSK